jgi:hypothetical protein
MIFVLAIFNSKASDLSKHQYIDSLNFEKRINIIDSKVVDLTNIFALHHIKEFDDVFFTPLKFEDSVIQYIQKPVSFENKIIAVCSMTKLPLDKYIDILNSYFTLFTENKINEQLLSRCIFNEFDTDYRLAKQYRNTLVRQLLNKMLNRKSLSKEFKINVKETLNGKWYNDLRRTGHLAHE